MLRHWDLCRRFCYWPESGRWTHRVKTKNARIGQRAGGAVRLPNGYEYWVLMIDGVDYSSSRLAWFFMTGEWPKNLIDHKNLNSLDDRWENLREADRAQNAWNSRKRKNNTSGYKGVYWNAEKKKWDAIICVRGKKIRLGRHVDPAVAAQFYVEAAKKYHGEFARA